jgi:hypothetical protein
LIPLLKYVKVNPESPLNPVNPARSTATLSQPTNGTYNLKYHGERSGVITVDNKIYFLLDNHTVDVYDAQANTWTTLTGNANTLWANTFASIGPSIYFAGRKYNGIFKDP